MMANNRQAFLDMLAYSEIGPALLSVSDNGYNVIVGSTAASPMLFTSYADHPRRLVVLRPGLKSTAAGRYQLLGRYFDHYRRQLNLDDTKLYPDGPFGKKAQDAIALQQIRECRALPLIDAGRFDEAVAKCARIWASLPGAGYGQHENKIEGLRMAYVRAGGGLA